jgi:fatty-acyl-CoA synthase
MLLNAPMAKEIDLRGWKVNTGGMALPRGLAKAALDMGVEVFHGYGMSETCPILTLANLKPQMMEWEIDRQLDFRTKTGFPIPLVDLKIVDEAGNPCRDGSPQADRCADPLVHSGLLQSPNIRTIVEDGRLHTGDIANMDEKHANHG